MTLIFLMPGRSATSSLYVFDLNARGFDVIFHRLGQSGEQKLIRGAVRARQHRRFFPFRGAPISREQAHLRSLKSGELTR